MPDERPARDDARRTIRQLGIIAALAIVVGGYLIIQQRDARANERESLRELQCTLAQRDNDPAAIAQHCD